MLTGLDKHMNPRTFSEDDKSRAFVRQGGRCNTPNCKSNDGKPYKSFSDMHADHKTPWSKGGRTVRDNCQLLCSDCNNRKANKR